MLLGAGGLALRSALPANDAGGDKARGAREAALSDEVRMACQM